MRYKAVIFDLDGTLVHTAPEYRYLVVGNTLRELGTASSNDDIDLFWFGAERDKIIQDHFGLEPKQFWDIFKKNDSSELRGQFTKPYDDVDFIKELRKNSYKTGIVTGAPERVVSVEIEMLGKENFDSIIIAQVSNGIKEKPHPEGLELCLKMIGVDKSKAIYMGNGGEDVAAAKNAQVYDVLIDRGELKFPDIKPTLTIQSLYELRDLLGLG